MTMERQDLGAADLTTKERIIEDALKLFAKNGYVGTTMEDLGFSVGIKKPSIYSHFKNKDEIFIEVIRKTMAADVEFIRQMLETYDVEDVKGFFENYFIKYAERCHSPGQLEHVKVLKRCALYPPPTLRQETADLFEEHYFRIESMITPVIIDAMEKGSLRKISPGYVVDVFHFVMDGIFMESHYINKWKHYARTEQAAKMFWNYIMPQEHHRIDKTEITVHVNEGTGKGESR